MQLHHNQKANSVPDKIFLSFTLSFFIVSTMLLFKPLSLVIENPSEFTSSTKELVFHYLSGLSTYLLLIFVVSFLILSIKKLRLFYISLIFAVGFLFYFQSSLLNWNYGPLDGKDIPWNMFWYRELIDVIIWSSIIVYLLIKREQLAKHVKLYVLALILVQGTAISFGLLSRISTEKKDAESAITNYSIDHSKKFLFSVGQNIFVLVLDTMSDSIVEDVIYENQSFIKEFDGFVRFDNVLGVGGYTAFSVPAYLTGIPYLNHVTFADYQVSVLNSENSLLKNLRDKEWNTGFYKQGGLRRANISPNLLTEIKNEGASTIISEPDLTKLSLYIGSPQFLKRWLFNIFKLSSFWEGEDQYILPVSGIAPLQSKLTPFPNNSNDLKFMNQMLSSASVVYKNPSFKYYHLKGAHVPHFLDKEFNNKQTNYKVAVYVSLKIAVRFIQIIKELGIYDSSQIYIMTDHGSYGLSSETKEVRKHIKNHYPQSAAALFMFKDFSTRGYLETSNIPLSFFDFSSIVQGLADKSFSVKATDFLTRFAEDKRNFYIFANTLSDNYFPKIIEAQVNGDVSEPSSWSLTGEEYIPSTVKPWREFNCLDDALSLQNRNEFFHYVPGNLMDFSGITRGSQVVFTLPLQKDCIQDDVVIKIRLAAVLGTFATSGEFVSSRKFYLSLNDGLAATDNQEIATEEFREYSYLINRRFIQDGTISFKMNLLDVHPIDYLTDRKGITSVASSLRLHSLEISKRKAGLEYIMFENSKKYSDYIQRLADMNKVKNALAKYHKKYDCFPTSQLWDGVHSNWGKSTPNYIEGLVPEFLNALPRDPSYVEGGQINYLYRSDGVDYKFLVHGVTHFDLSKVDKKLVDPRRETWAFGTWSAGAKDW